jgi:hypothetical protein
MAAVTTSVAVPRPVRRAPPRPRVSVHLVLVSPGQARDIMAHEVYARQRPLRPYQVAYLQTLMEHGHFRQGTTITFAVREKRRYVINGQHTLVALGQTGGAPVWLQMEEYRVESEEEVGALYATYDRNLARSWADLYAADVRLQQYDLGRVSLRTLGGAVPILASGFHEARTRFTPQPWVQWMKDPYIRFALMGAWKDEMLTFLNGLRGPGGVRKLLLRASVLAVALVTVRWQGGLAQQFWPSVARDSGLSEGQPAHTLLRWLRETPTRRLDAGGYQRLVASAWNAYVDGRELYRLQGRGGEQPLLLAGTPHDGRGHYGYVSAGGEVRHQPEEVVEVGSGGPAIKQA